MKKYVWFFVGAADALLLLALFTIPWKTYVVNILCDSSEDEKEIRMLDFEYDLIRPKTLTRRFDCTNLFCTQDDKTSEICCDLLPNVRFSQKPSFCELLISNQRGAIVVEFMLEFEGASLDRIEDLIAGEYVFRGCPEYVFGGRPERGRVWDDFTSNEKSSLYSQVRDRFGKEMIERVVKTQVYMIADSKYKVSQCCFKVDNRWYSLAKYCISPKYRDGLFSPKVSDIDALKCIREAVPK